MANNYEWYWYGDCCCVVGTTYAFDNTYDMEEYMGCEGMEIETPDYATDDMPVY